MKNIEHMHPLSIRRYGGGRAQAAARAAVWPVISNLVFSTSTYRMTHFIHQPRSQLNIDYGTTRLGRGRVGTDPQNYAYIGLDARRFREPATLSLGDVSARRSSGPRSPALCGHR